MGNSLRLMSLTDSIPLRVRHMVNSPLLLRASMAHSLRMANPSKGMARRHLRVIP